MPKTREDMIKPINQVSLGEKVYRARMEKRMSVNEVAGHLGISEIFLRQIEMSRRIQRKRNSAYSVCTADSIQHPIRFLGHTHRAGQLSLAQGDGSADDMKFFLCR